MMVSQVIFLIHYSFPTKLSNHIFVSTVSVSVLSSRISDPALSLSVEEAFVASPKLKSLVKSVKIASKLVSATKIHHTTLKLPTKASITKVFLGSPFLICLRLLTRATAFFPDSGPKVFEI